MTITGKELERRVAQAYRELGARRVEHDIELAGHQIDICVELETQDHSIHRVVIEAKEYTSPVGIQIVSDFSDIVDRLRRERLADEGVIVSTAGFSKQARNAANKHGLRLLQPEDLEAIVGERLKSLLLASQQLKSSGKDIRELRSLSDNQAKLISRFEKLRLDLKRALASPSTAQALIIGNKYTKVAEAIASNSAKEIQATLPSSSHLSIKFVCDLHKSLFPAGYALTGLRRTQVWVGRPGSTALDEADFVPPPASKIKGLLQELLSSWNSQFKTLVNLSEEEKITAVAEFHTRFWSIHPFYGGNGDVSRLMLSMQLRDIFNKKVNVTYSKTGYSSAALLSATLGNQQPLMDVIRSLVQAT